jgi:hypothetical protein
MLNVVMLSVVSPIKCPNSVWLGLGLELRRDKFRLIKLSNALETICIRHQCRKTIVLSCHRCRMESKQL